jgi:hypothetical protein
MNVVVAGNFQVTSLSMTPGFQHTGTWHDFFTGSSLEVTDLNAPLEFAAGEYHLWTDVALETPDNILGIHEARQAASFDIVPNPGVDSELIFHAPLGVETEMQVYDLTGNRVAQQRLAAGAVRAGLPRGIAPGPMLVRLVSPAGNCASYWLKTE